MLFTLLRDELVRGGLHPKQPQEQTWGHQDLLYVHHNMSFIGKMIENEFPKTRMWLAIEYDEIELEPDTETELSPDDE